jgi:hypothetical protein
MSFGLRSPVKRGRESGTVGDPLTRSSPNHEAIAETNTDLCSLSGNGNASREVRQLDAVGSIGAKQSEI